MRRPETLEFENLNFSVPSSDGRAYQRYHAAMDLGPKPLTAEEQAVLQPVADRLRHLIAIPTTNLVHDATFKPAPDSRIDKTKKADLNDAYDLAGHALAAAEDHLRTILSLLAPDMMLPSFSMFTLIRGAAMPTVHARHLLEPSISETMRLGRALSARLKNLEQQQKVHPEAQGAFIVDRVDHLTNRAEANGIAIIRNKKDAVIGFGEMWPTDTDLFEKYIPEVGKTFWQFLSGHAHSMAWIQLPISRALPSDQPGIVIVPTAVDVPNLAAVLNGTLTLYDETVGIYIDHAGYPAMVWNEAKKG
jgi:hypothetical protein